MTRNVTAEEQRLRDALSRQNDEICQILGQALGYPWFKDDPKNFPDAAEVDGVCVGDHVAESIAEEAARAIRKLREETQAFSWSAFFLGHTVACLVFVFSYLLLG